MARAIPKSDRAFDPSSAIEDEPPYVPLLGAEQVGGDDGFPPAYILSPAESQRQYDEAVQKYMGMGSEEFLRRWDAGEWHELYDDGEHWWIGYLIGIRSLAHEE